MNATTLLLTLARAIETMALAGRAATLVELSSPTLNSLESNRLMLAMIITDTWSLREIRGLDTAIIEVLERKNRVIDNAVVSDKILEIENDNTIGQLVVKNESRIDSINISALLVLSLALENNTHEIVRRTSDSSIHLRERTLATGEVKRSGGDPPEILAVVLTRAQKVLGSGGPAPNMHATTWIVNGTFVI